MRYMLLATCLLAGCAHEPYVALPAIAPVTLQPLHDSNAKVKAGNQAIKAGNQAIGKQLEVTRDHLDQAIVEAHQAKIDSARLDQLLSGARVSLESALAERGRQDARIDLQDQVITQQAEAITGKQTELDQRQIQIDNQTRAGNKARQAEADQAKIIDEVQKWWGIGGIIYGVKRLGWHILIVLLVMALASFLLNMFVPAARPIFALVTKFFSGVGSTIWAALKKLNPWKPKPPP